MILNKKIIALVPARGGSKGIKLKNLKKIKSKTLVEITSNFIDKLKLVDLKVLNSENHKILKIGKKLKFMNILRPKSLSGDNVADYPVIKFSLNELKKKKLHFDYLIYLPPTTPTRKIKHLKDALKIVIKKKAFGAWSVTKIDKKYHPLKILLNEKGFIKLNSRLGKNVINRQSLSDIYIRNGVFYIFSIRHLNKFKTIYLKNLILSETKYEISNIDNIEDLKNARKIFNKFK